MARRCSGCLAGPAAFPRSAGHGACALCRLAPTAGLARMSDSSNHLVREERLDLIQRPGQRVCRARGAERKIVSLPAVGVMYCEPVTDHSGVDHMPSLTDG